MICPNCKFDLGKIKGRSGNENRYFHGVVIPVLAQHESFGGWTCEEIKEYLKDKFLGFTKTMRFGDMFEDVRVIRPSSSLTTVEWERWMTEIRVWASSKIEDGGLSCYIPEPNEHTVIV